MRILCLHGDGTNSGILETQIAPLRAKLDSSWDFVFLDGEVEAEAAEGVEEIFDGPWLCYYDDPTPEKIKTAQDLIFEVVREEGPFDAVLGFSQGAALASSIMLAHARAGRRQNIFGVAILLSPTLPFDVDSGILNLSFNTDEGLKAIRTSDEFGTKFEDITQQDWMTDRRTAGVLAVFDQRRGPRSRTNPDQQSIDVLLRYHASTNPTLKIHVPTVVVLGMKDGYGYDCFDVVELCDARTSRVVKHDGGHHLPRSAVDTMKMVEAIEWAVEKTKMIS